MLCGKIRPYRMIEIVIKSLILSEFQRFHHTLPSNRTWIDIHIRCDILFIFRCHRCNFKYTWFSLNLFKIRNPFLCVWHEQTSISRVRKNKIFAIFCFVFVVNETATTSDDAHQIWKYQVRLPIFFSHLFLSKNKSILFPSNVYCECTLRGQQCKTHNPGAYWQSHWV